MINAMSQSAHYQVPFLLAGEIIEAQEEALTDAVDDNTKKEIAVGYVVLVEFPNGSTTVYRNVAQCCMFGGIGDFFQPRLRASSDASGQYSFPEETSNASINLASVGSRVLVAFIGGDIRRPVIVGFLPHPSRVMDVPNFEEKETQAKLSYKGFEVTSNSVGETKFTHRGSPGEIDERAGKQVSLSVREDVGPQDLPERENLQPLPSPALDPILPTKVLAEASLADPTENSALSYPDRKYTSELGFLELGEWYVVDSEGQQIMLDRDAKTVTITNNNDTIQIDKEHKKIFIKSSGDIEVKAAGNHVSSIQGNKHQTVSLNEWYAVKGSEYRSIGDTRTTNVADADTTKTGTSWQVSVGSAETVPGGTGSSKEKHHAGIVLSTGNSFVMDDDSIMLVHKTGALITIDKTGNVLLMAADGTNFNLNGSSGVFTLMSKFGALLSIDDKVTCIDSTGKQTIVLKDGVVDIMSGDQVTVSAPNVSVNAGNVTLGNQALMSAVCGENLQAWLDSHTHIWGGGPTSPPVIPTASLKAGPLDILSTAVKIRKGM